LEPDFKNFPKVGLVQLALTAKRGKWKRKRCSQNPPQGISGAQNKNKEKGNSNHTESPLIGHNEKRRHGLHWGEESRRKRTLGGGLEAVVQNSWAKGGGQQQKTRQPRQEGLQPCEKTKAPVRVQQKITLKTTKARGGERKHNPCRQR